MVKLSPYSKSYDAIIRYQTDGTAEKYISCEETAKNHTIEAGLSLLLLLFIGIIVIFISRMKISKES